MGLKLITKTDVAEGDYHGISENEINVLGWFLAAKKH
jgi:hypothetical protein